MTKSIFKTLVVLCTFLMVFTSCTKEAPLEVLNEANTPSTNNADLSLYIAETDELITVSSMAEIKDIIQTNYSHLEYAEASIEKLEAYEEELAYSETLDLEDPVVEEEYIKQLNRKYKETTASRAGSGILYDGQASGFLSLTHVPINLSRSKRNRASSIVGTFGTTVLCDRIWWRGQKVVFFGIGKMDLNNLGFDNRTDSFF